MFLCWSRRASAAGTAPSRHDFFENSRCRGSKQNSQENQRIMCTAEMPDQEMILHSFPSRKEWSQFALSRDRGDGPL